MIPIQISIKTKDLKLFVLIDLRKTREGLVDNLRPRYSPERTHDNAKNLPTRRLPVSPLEHLSKIFSLRFALLARCPLRHKGFVALCVVP